jgi:hypothetical protein
VGTSLEEEDNCRVALRMVEVAYARWAFDSGHFCEDMAFES